MFTGIIKELGVVREFKSEGNLYRLAVECKDISKGSKIGDSVAVNGVCLTIKGKNKNLLYFDAVEETIRKTNLKRLKTDNAVNLEGSLKSGDPLGGHFVLGHIDCVGRITAIEKRTGDKSIEVEMPEEFTGLAVKKGSIAIEGISLTVGDIKRNRLKVYLIPHTLKATTLGAKEVGDTLNIEFDIIGKHVSALMDSGPGIRITEEFLKEKGF